MFFKSFTRLVPRARLVASARPPLVRVRRVQPSFLATTQRYYATPSSADEAIEEITEQYSTAKDEFEIAQEETEKKSVYAEDDRKAAREELEKLKDMFNGAVQSSDHGEEVRNRVGQRIRELESAVKNLEDLAMKDD